MTFSQNYHGVFVLWWLLSLPSNSVAATDSATLRLSSGSVQTPLLELYTSEGCSSCPPADRWLQSLSQSDGLWKRYVPVAFHVTYWNYLGWRDRFSQPAFDARQRAVAKRASSGVYTPGLFLQGREWRSWRRQSAAERLLSEQQRPLAGVLQAHIQCDGGKVQFISDPTAPEPASHVELAWLRSSQHSNVASGENRGRTLSHDFVVVQHERIPLLRSGTQVVAQPRWSARFSADCALTSQNQAVALWVTNAQGVPIQAVGGYLPNGFAVTDPKG